MGDSEHRHIARESLFLMADLRIDGIKGEQRIRIRNLSSGGMMAECPTIVQRGQLIWAKLRKIGWVEGSVAWVQNGRFGVAFRHDIDLLAVSAPMNRAEPAPHHAHPPLMKDEAGPLHNI